MLSTPETAWYKRMRYFNFTIFTAEEMDKILEEAGLSTLLQRFKDERIEPELLDAMTDAELSRLGVTTIGDRARLRAVCRNMKLKENDNENHETPEDIPSTNSEL